MILLHLSPLPEVFLGAPACLDNQLRFWGAQAGGSAGSHCHRHWPHTPGTQLCPRAPASSQDAFSKLPQISVASFPPCVCSLLVKLDQRTESGFLAVEGEFLQCSCPQMFNLAGAWGEGQYLQTQEHSHIAVPIFHLVHLHVDCSAAGG